MIQKAAPLLISVFCSYPLLVATAKPIADADIPRVNGGDLVSHMTPPVSYTHLRAHET